MNKAANSPKWSDGETQKFYRAIKIFGTDFQMISGLFRNRSRNQIKNKFRKEENSNFIEVNNSLQRNQGMKYCKLRQKLSILKQEHLKALQNRKEQKPRDTSRKGSCDSSNIEAFSAFVRKRFESFKSIDSLDLGIIEEINAMVQQP